MSTKHFMQGVAGAFQGARSALDLGIRLGQIEQDAKDSALNRRMATERHKLSMKQGDQQLRLASAREKRAVQDHAMSIKQKERAYERLGLQMEDEKYYREQVRPLELQQKKYAAQGAKLNFEAAQRKETEIVRLQTISQATNQAKLRMQNGDTAGAIEAIGVARESGLIPAGDYATIEQDMAEAVKLVREGGFNPEDPKTREILSRHFATNMEVTGRTARGFRFDSLVPVDGDPTKFHMMMRDPNGGLVPLTEGATDDPGDPAKVIGIDQIGAVMRQNAELAFLQQRVDQMRAAGGIDVIGERQSALAAAQDAQLARAKDQSVINKNNAAAAASARANRPKPAKVTPGALPESHPARGVQLSLEANKDTKHFAPLIPRLVQQYPSVTPDKMRAFALQAQRQQEAAGETDLFGNAKEADKDAPPQLTFEDMVREEHLKNVEGAANEMQQTAIADIANRMKIKYGIALDFSDKAYTREIINYIEENGGMDNLSEMTPNDIIGGVSEVLDRISEEKAAKEAERERRRFTTGDVDGENSGVY